MKGWRWEAIPEWRTRLAVPSTVEVNRRLYEETRQRRCTSCGRAVRETECMWHRGQMHVTCAPCGKCLEG